MLATGGAFCFYAADEFPVCRCATGHGSKHGWAS